MGQMSTIANNSRTLTNSWTISSKVIFVCTIKTLRRYRYKIVSNHRNIWPSEKDLLPRTLWVRCTHNRSFFRHDVLTQTHQKFRPALTWCTSFAALWTSTLTLVLRLIVFFFYLVRYNVLLGKGLRLPQLLYPISSDNLLINLKSAHPKNVKKILNPKLLYSSFPANSLMCEIFSTRIELVRVFCETESVNVPIRCEDTLGQLN